jgi:hypothetical protein
MLLNGAAQIEETAPQASNGSWKLRLPVSLVCPRPESVFILG